MARADIGHSSASEFSGVSGKQKAVGVQIGIRSPTNPPPPPPVRIPQPLCLCCHKTGIRFDLGYTGMIYFARVMIC